LDDRPVGTIAARDPLEEIVERADRAAEQRPRAREQLPLGAVDVRPVRHDQYGVGLERAQIALEQERHLAGVGRACEQAESHRTILVSGSDGSLAVFSAQAAADFGRRPRRAAAWPGNWP